jgi:bifunctional DNA-binding transcriptional regulator/antitoxin component of YhaV-PrlF toxin-antitoxin module
MTGPMQDAVHTRMSTGRRIVIPADLCHAYGFAPGLPVVLEPTEQGIVVRPLDELIRDVQAYFAGTAPKGVRLSDELLRDRREEAARESRD